MATLPLPTILPCLAYRSTTMASSYTSVASQQHGAISTFSRRTNLGLSQGRIGSGLRDVYTNCLSPGSSDARGTRNALTNSMYLFSGVEILRN